MIIGNCLVKDQIVSIEIIGEKIKRIGTFEGKWDLDARGKRVIPGLVDIHIHGAYGYDTMNGDFREISTYLAAHGTTSFCPTTMTASREALRSVTEKSTEVPGAEILGFHLEGPFIAASRKGAQDGTQIRPASMEEFDTYPNVRMITVAPETEGCLQFIKAASRKCAVALGHTDADYEMAKKAFENGANGLTHTFNAMPPLLNRNSGPVGAAIDCNAYAQVIVDGLHVEKACVLMLYRTLGPDRVILISDSIQIGGMPDGSYVVGNVDVTVKNGIARVADGHLAGSTATLLECVKTAVSFGIPFEDAVKMASETPAKAIGITNKGKLSEGYDADLVLLNDDLSVDTVMIRGKAVR